MHDYLTQSGGAERVALSIARGFGLDTIHTSIYRPTDTFPEFSEFEVRQSFPEVGWIAGIDPRLVFPFMRRAISRVDVSTADVVVCSSSGWAHAVSAQAPSVVYFHTPARWLYEPDDYFKGQPSLLPRVLGPHFTDLRKWDQERVAEARVLLANSRVVAERIAKVYRRDAEVVHPPVAVDVTGPAQRPAGVDGDFYLVIARGRGYKNTSMAVSAAESLGVRVVVVGAEGRSTCSTTTYLGRVREPELRWLYRNCAALIAPAAEDFGLTPIEANAYGKPVIALRAGGYLDSMVEDETVTFFDELSTAAIADAVKRSKRRQWRERDILRNADRFSERTFIRRLEDIAEAVAA